MVYEHIINGLKHKSPKVRAHILGIIDRILDEYVYMYACMYVCMSH